MSSIKGPIKRVGEEPHRATSRPNQAPANEFVRPVCVNCERSKNTTRKRPASLTQLSQRTGWKTVGLIITTGANPPPLPPGLLSPTRPILRLENRLQAGCLSRIAYYSFLLITSKISIPVGKLFLCRRSDVPRLLPKQGSPEPYNAKLNQV